MEHERADGHRLVRSPRIAAFQIDLRYVSTQLLWWYAVTGAIRVESGHLVAHALAVPLATSRPCGTDNTPPSAARSARRTRAAASRPASTADPGGVDRARTTPRSRDYHVVDHGRRNEPSAHQDL